MARDYSDTERTLNTALRSFRVHNNKSGFKCTIEAIKLAWVDQNRMLNLKRDIYEVVAADQGMNAAGVFSEIQRVTEKAWKNNKKLLQAYDKSLATAPTNSELFEILLHFLEDPDREKYIEP